MNDQPPDPAAEPDAAPEADAQRESLLALAARVPVEVKALITAEANLASAEMRRNLTGLALAFAFILAGGIVFGIAGISVLGGIVAALAPYVGPVWSALITAATALVAGAALMAAGIRKMKHGPLAPRQSITNLQRHIESLTPQSRKPEADEPKPDRNIQG